MKKEKYIYKTKTGWKIAIFLPNERFFFTVNFKDNGGIKKSLDAAIEIRNDYLHSQNESHRLKYKTRSPKSTSSYDTQPCVGVVLKKKKLIKGGFYYRWFASYRKNNKTHYKVFSVKKYGECGAFQKACEVRYKYMGDIRIQNKKLLPCLPTVPYLFI